MQVIVVSSFCEAITLNGYPDFRNDGYISVGRLGMVEYRIVGRHTIQAFSILVEFVSPTNYS